MKKSVCVGLLALGTIAILACEGEPQQDAGTERSRREIDSTIGASALPGARGITRAMTAADSAAARNQLLDSLSADR